MFGRAGCLVAEGNGSDVFADERVPFGAWLKLVSSRRSSARSA
jgi:hypothetical protein